MVPICLTKNSLLKKALEEQGYKTPKVFFSRERRCLVVEYNHELGFPRTVEISKVLVENFPNIKGLLVDEYA